ncbi:MAG TPA: RluA family pseudouridine synthase [Pirellulales bacterium]|jgi:RluA family pseudouridine synthase|nr:RluA family pseudouridine synthase [Pirellulales bacterium]
MLPELDILFEDDHCLVVNKLPGLSTQAPRGIDSLELQVRTLLQARVNADMVYWQCDPSGQAPTVYLGVPHRLDRPVSGVIVMAKTKKGARKISKQFEQRSVKKLYWAAVEGIVEPAAGTWIDWLRKIPGEARVEVVEENHPEGQRAVLHYRTLGNTPHGSWLEIELKTGRMHQLRVQTASRGHPVLGDAQYGSRLAFGLQYEDLRLQAIALHARQLSFAQAVTQEQLTFVAPVGNAWHGLGIIAEVAGFVKPEAEIR